MDDFNKVMTRLKERGISFDRATTILVRQLLAGEKPVLTEGSGRVNCTGNALAFQNLLESGVATLEGEQIDLTHEGRNIFFAPGASRKTKSRYGRAEEEDDGEGEYEGDGGDTGEYEPDETSIEFDAETGF